MNEFHNHPGLTITRRLLFVAALLFVGPISVAFFQYRVRAHQGELTPDVVFFWGMDSLPAIVAVWLVMRSHVWTSWQGWVRAAIYLVAFSYGRILFDATQERWIDPESYIHLPGTRFEDFARPAIDTLMVLMMAWLLTPIAMICLAELSTPTEPATRSRHFSIWGLIGFVTLAAIIMGWVQLLASDFAPQTNYSNASTAKALQIWLGQYAPMHIPHLLAAMLIMFALTKRWWWALAALPAAILFDALCTQLIIYVVKQFNGNAQFGILSNANLNRWLYITGRSLTLWSALCTASLLGVRPYFGRRREAPVEPEPEVSPIDAD
ncbi:hypothetical protein GC197_03280 [bacterium]|nr:hypothetical protein [bacterium]